MSHFGEALTDLAGNSFRILLYHSISDEQRYPFSVSPKEFSWQMDWLHQQGGCVQSLNKVLSGEGYASQGCQPQIVISFDDGYEDNFTNAMPILQKYGYRATFFIVTGFVGKANLWATDPATPYLKLMNWEQIVALSEKGYIIGSHTHHHINLKITEPTQLKEDLAESRHLLAEKLAKDFIPFAYPYGKYTEATIDFVKEIGYSCALMAGGFWGNCVRTSRWQLRREDIHRGTSRRDFMAQVRGAVDPHYIKLGFNYLLGSS